MPWLGENLLWLSGGLIDGLVQGLSLLADVFTPWLPVSVPIYIWLLSAAGVLILLLPAGMVLRPLGWLLVLALFAPREQIPAVRSRCCSWMLARVWRLPCVPAITLCCTTQAPSQGIWIRASGWWCRFCVQWGG